MSALSPAQQLRLDLYRERFAIDPATALDGAIAAYNWIVGPAPEMVRIAEIDPSSFRPRKIPEIIVSADSASPPPPPEKTATLGEDVQPQAEQRPWTEAEETELERLSAAGLGYKEIALRLGRSLQGVNMRVSETGISRRWPRGPGGTLKFTPHPLSAPWPPVERAAATSTPPRRQALKNAEIDQFRALCAEGLEPREIEARFGWARNGAHSRAGRLGFSALWREARERRRAERHAEPKPEPEPVPEPESEPEPAPVQEQPVTPTPPAPLPSASERERQIEAHIAQHGVQRSIDFGLDQPAVDALRNAGWSVVRSRNPRAPWLIGQGEANTPALWERANRERQQRGLPPIRRGKP